MNVVNLHTNPFIKGIKRIFKSCPTIFENVVGIYKDTSSAEIRSYSCNDEKELSMNAELINWAGVQRKSTKNAAQWFEPEAIGKYKNNCDIFGEKATALLIYHSSYSEENKNDLIILYLKLSGNPLFVSPEEFSNQDKKMVIAYLMEIIIKECLSREYEIHRLMESIDEHFKTIKSFQEYKNDELDQSKRKQLDYARYILKELNEKYGIHILLSKAAEQIIIDYKGEYQNLEDELVKAVKITINTRPCLTGVIELDEISLIGLAKKNIEDSKTAFSGKSAVHSTDADKNIKMGQYSRTEALLNRLEAAVKSTIENNEKVTGQNVASHMQPFKISAPAISDSISNHNARIKTLMSREPSRWRLLRERFRPIQNILNTNFEQDQEDRS